MANDTIYQIQQQLNMLKKSTQECGVEIEKTRQMQEHHSINFYKHHQISGNPKFLLWHFVFISKNWSRIVPMNFASNISSITVTFAWYSPVIAAVAVFPTFYKISGINISKNHWFSVIANFASNWKQVIIYIKNLHLQLHCFI